MDKFALLSVFDKEGIVEFAKGLANLSYTNISTGGTYKKINEAGLAVKKVEEVAGFPEILEGRVKTLQPKIHGGILAKRDNEEHMKQVNEHEIPLIDVVAVNLYPFEKTVLSGADLEECIENIDIGGPAMIRAAAKNHKDVIVATNPEQYEFILKYLTAGEVPLEFRMKLADEAFTHTARYDAIISGWFRKQRNDISIPKYIVMPFDLTDLKMRYGTNKNQNETGLYKRAGTDFGLTTIEQYTSNGEWKRITVKANFHGKALSYNNLFDVEVAVGNVARAIEELGDVINAVVDKHGNDCGNAIGQNAEEAIKLSTSGDTISSFGGIHAVYGVVDEKAAEEIVNGPLPEIIIALDYTKQGIDVLTKKKNLRILKTCFEDNSNDRFSYRIGSDGGHLLLENKVYDLVDEKKLQVVSGDKNFYEDNKDLIHFGIVTCQNKFSNTITLVEEVKEGVYRQIGFGAGNANRVLSVKQACDLAKENFENEFEEKIKSEESVDLLIKYFNENTKHQNPNRHFIRTEPFYKDDYVKSRMGKLILVSDSFFPFPDNIEVAHRYGIKNIVEDGGSINDEIVFKKAQEYGMNMLITGIRYFRH